jgi:GT2 family glycosyltransferase
MIDNASTDDTQQFLKLSLSAKDNVTLFLLDTNLGIIDGRNLGWKHSLENSGARLMFLDNDQIVHKDWLGSFIAMLDQGYDIVGTEAWMMSKSFVPIRKIRSLNQNFSYVGCGGMIMSNEVKKMFRGFDSQFSPCYFEDPDLIFSAIEKGFKIGWNIAAGISHLEHSTLGKMDNTDRRNKFIASYIKFRKKWIGKPISCLRQEYIENFGKRRI